MKNSSNISNVNSKYADDLSYGKASSQILTLPPPLLPNDQTVNLASNAVDRNPSTCTGTEPIGTSSKYTSVWWRVDLGGIYSIHSIRILFKDYGPQYVTRQRGRFAGFSIFLSNSTKKEDWILCYKDGPELPPLDFNTTCMIYGRYIIYYNERLKGVTYPETTSSTTLCEVIVDGCAKKGVYGVNCDQPCPINCQEQRCHIDNGNCLCKPGYTGDKCETYVQRTFQHALMDCMDLVVKTNVLDIAKTTVPAIMSLVIVHGVVLRGGCGACVPKNVIRDFTEKTVRITVEITVSMLHVIELMVVVLLDTLQEISLRRVS
ncbi:uncharacterized protein LOC133180169 [Saccostrea echinata]|uniref:uncharacterized protein LOC133180169 n=1 Tax=Saccostrea echinata TaxID=191078 RepID=UPI002A80ADA5|nr:uncharacterized protein LOC133180169 [Saccostrea echinata]